MLGITSPSATEVLFSAYTEEQQARPSAGTTPYFTASTTFPHLQNQEFFNAIENRFILNGPFVKDQQQQGDQVMAQQFPMPAIATAVTMNILKLPPVKNNNQQPMTTLAPTNNVNHCGMNINAFTPEQANELLGTLNTLIIDVRSFVKYNQLHIKGSVSIAVPNTILKRPSFTLDKVSEAIVTEVGRHSWKNYMQMTHIIFYDDNSNSISPASPNAIYYLAMKLSSNSGYQGIVGFLKGGMDVFVNKHADNCVGEEYNNGSTPPVTQSSSPAIPPTPGLSGLPPVVVGSLPTSKNRLKRRPIDGLHLGSLPQAPLTSSEFANQAFNPFFSNIRQNMELSHGGIKERFPVRFPDNVQYNPDSGSVTINGKLHQMRHCVGMPNNYTLPIWLQRCLAPDNGPKFMAESYEAIERCEQKRLKGVMAHHSKVTDNLTDHPFSIVAAIEKGTLNRYTNVWPFEYTRVKLHDKENDYINASFIQYVDVDTATVLSSNQVPTLLSLKEQNDTCRTGRHYSQYISTQGPLPTTFNDFWSVVWDENSRVIVMLTKEEEMNRIKCHKYWPTQGSMKFGSIIVKFTSETKRMSKSQNDIGEDIVLTTFEVSKADQETRLIQHLQYKGWQDYGVPDNPLGTLELVTLAREMQSAFEHADTSGPMIVHCSAGCGRTGAFCTIDTLMARLCETHYLTKEEQAGEIDLIYQTVSKFREQRVSMVQTLRQYVFCYEAILWWILNIE